MRRPHSNNKLLVPFHEFLDSVILRDHEVYTEEGCDTLNLFEVEGTSDASNFNRIAVLGRILAAKNSMSTVGTGYITFEQVVDDCHSVGILPETSNQILSFLISRRVIETETSIRDSFELSKYVRITSSGEYYINSLCKVFGYLDMIIGSSPD